MARTDYYQNSKAPAANSIVVAVTAYIVNKAGQILLIRRADNDLLEGREDPYYT